MSKERAAQLVDAGVWLKLSGDLDGARRLFERALKLDPGNEKARQLLAAPTGEVPTSSPSAETSNPFERAGASSPSAVEREWGIVTGPGGTKTPAPFRSGDSSLDQDWGRMTGAESPVPKVAPVIPPVAAPSAAGLPPPPAFSTSPSQATAQFAMPKEVRGAAPSSPSAPGTMVFAMPDEVRQAAAAPASSSPSGTLRFAMPDEVRQASSPSAASSPSGTLAFAMPDEVKAALGDAPPGATDRFAAMPAPFSPKPSAEDDFQAMAEEAPVDTSLPVERRPLKSSPSSRVATPLSPPAQASSPSGTLHFAIPDEVRAALGQAPASSPSSPSQVSSSPSGTMVFARPSAVEQVVKPQAEADEFDKLADEAEEIPLSSRGSKRVAPLPKPAARKGPGKKGAAAREAPAPAQPEDWGHLTEDTGRAAGSDSLAATPSSAGLPPPPAYSSPSQPGSTQQFAMPREVAPARSSSPSGTLQFALPKDVRQELPPEPHPVPKTISLSGEEAPRPPETVVLTGDAPPPEPPKATPPLFSIPEAEPGTPSMFSGGAPDPMAAFNPALLSAPAPPGLARKPDAPPDSAWQWKASSTPPQITEEAPVPRPSPTLDPKAQSAWDLRSNPGIKLEAVVGADRAMDLLSSDSKVQRDPAKAKQDEIATILRGARDLLDLDDHTGAMELIDKAEKLSPDSPEVRQLKERSERTLLAMFESRLGHLEKLPRVLLKDDEIIWLNLDHRAGFVLAQIDGTVTFEDLFAVSGMSRLDTARILAQLVDEGVISRG